MRTSTCKRTAITASGLAAAVMVLPLVAGCGQADGTPARASNESPATTPSLPRGADPVDLDPAEFTAGSDHPYFPLEPGRQWTFREIDESGARLEVVVTVTNQTRKIANGIEARVVRDTVTEEGALIEDTLDWYAQDADGNVWYLGEDTAEFEDGKLTTRGGSFEAGVDGALPGVIMPADPVAGMQYRQEYYKDEAEDNGEIIATGHQADVAQGHFDDVVLTADTITIEPEVLEYKLYAPGVGLVMALGISGGGGREELVSTRKVSDSTAEAAGMTPLGEPYK